MYCAEREEQIQNEQTHTQYILSLSSISSRKYSLDRINFIGSEIITTNIYFFLLLRFKSVQIKMGFLAATGAFALVYVTARLAAFFYRLLCPVKLDIKKFGEWALITGSTDGIGRAYAIELAKRGR